MSIARIHDETTCLLGEGALWHPERAELLWFDILGRTLFAGGRRHRLGDLASAAGWVDRDTILLAQRGALMRFDLRSGEAERVAALEAEGVRPNDGRADPWGGFWISTMGLKQEKGKGAIWRYFRGEVRRIAGGITIPNAICFDPEGRHAWWTDTDEGIVRRQPLDGAEGWPAGEAEPALDFRAEGLNPDGAVTDAEGNIWIAFWGAGMVRGYAPDGTRLEDYAVPAAQSTCPAWGGEGFSTLYVTSAAVGLSQDDLTEAPESGRTFAIETGRRGRAEPQVAL